MLIVALIQGYSHCPTFFDNKPFPIYGTLQVALFKLDTCKCS